MKGVEKVKYISGEEGGENGQDSTVRYSLILFAFNLFDVFNWTFTVCDDSLCF